MKIVNKILLIMFFAVFVSNSNAASLEEIKTQAYSRAKAITSIQFTSTFDDSLILNKERDNRRNQGRIEYLQSGKRYLIKSVLSNANEDGDNEFVTAFDGQRYQVFSRNTKELNFKKTELTDLPNRFMNPLLVMYSWLVLGSSKAAQQGIVLSTYADVKNQDLWDDCFKNAILLDTNDSRLQRVRFVNSYDGVTTDVTFDRDQGVFPVDVISKSKQADETFHVDHIIKKDADGEIFYFPVKMTVTSKTVDFEMTSTLQIDPSTIDVNTVYDNDIFTIPETWADTVADIDEVNSGRGMIRPSKFSVILKACFGILGAVLIIVSIYYKSKQCQRAT
ncbi:MAG: hypothetical protein Q4G68_01360 [Planctomycetia bacterium]|nr:hypothetical protein [Planctomycetia bacterium]